MQGGEIHMGMKKRRKCGNKICDNLSRRFEGKYCCIICADLHDGIIHLQDWYYLINKYYLEIPRRI